MKPASERIDPQELIEVLGRARLAPLREDDYKKLLALIESFVLLTELLEEQKVTIAKLRELFSKSSTEKTAKVLRRVGAKGSPKPSQDGPKEPKPQPKGHGRNAAQDYTGAQKVEVPHPALKSGDRCPECLKGKLYRQKEPAVLVRFTGQAPLAATVYERERLRCNLCGEVFTAPVPDAAGTEKYAPSAIGMIALLRYGEGLPLNRLEDLQKKLGIPLPAATQWDLLDGGAGQLQAVWLEFVRQAAQGDVMHNDDTGMKVLSLMAEVAKAEQDGVDPPKRTGMFTTGIISIVEGHKIALYFTGRKHAGENLFDVVRQRADGLGPPILMCDALSRNLPKPLQVILANCMAHSRRRYVGVTPNFPAECEYVLKTLGEVYRNDAATREQGMTPKERLAFHQAQSKPLMDELAKWMAAQFTEKKVEPNSGLGEAIGYMQRHWSKLTLFLEKEGAPLDNNILERMLKKAILHRRNSLFYKTERGAHVGDLYMSLIYTCELNGVNPFEYLTALLTNAERAAKNPEQWMPWNWHLAMERTGAVVAA